DDASAARRRVDLHVDDTGLRGQRPIDAPDASRAAHAVDQEQRLATAGPEVADRVARDLGTGPDAMRVVRADAGAHRSVSVCAVGTFSSRSPTSGSAASGCATAITIVTMQPAIVATKSASAS